LVTVGDFTHVKKKNLDAFFGQELVNAYHMEKKLTGCGLYITDEANKNGS